MSEYVPPSNVISRTGAGVVGGIAGGVVLGIILQIMGFMPQFASLVGHVTTGWAWIAQLTVAAVAGAVFGILAGRAVSHQLVSAGGIGLVYGVLLGVLFVLAVLPLAHGDDAVPPGRQGDAGHRGVRAVRHHRRRDLRDRRAAPAVLRVRGPAADLRLHHPGQPASAAQARQRLILHSGASGPAAQLLTRCGVSAVQTRQPVDSCADSGRLAGGTRGRRALPCTACWIGGPTTIAMPDGCSCC